MSSVFSTHVLNGTNGTHAAGVQVALANISASSQSTQIFADKTDVGGRLVKEIDLSSYDAKDVYELTFDMAGFWQSQIPDWNSPQLVSEIVVRLKMPDPKGRYHIPIISSPNSYSIWWSGLEANLL